MQRKLGKAARIEHTIEMMRDGHPCVMPTSDELQEVAEYYEKQLNKLTWNEHVINTSESMAQVACDLMKVVCIYAIGTAFIVFILGIALMPSVASISAIIKGVL